MVSVMISTNKDSEKAKKPKKNLQVLLNSFLNGVGQFILGIAITIFASILMNIAVSSLHPKYEIGDVVTFGAFEQDNNEDNGKESIEWYVIAKENGQYLLLSKYILDACSYNGIDESTSWELCSIRKWLNVDFLNSSFSDKEKEYITAVTNTNPNNGKYGTEGGNATYDKVFFLSTSEANEYLTGEMADGICTDYATANGGYTFEPYTGDTENTDAVLKYTFQDPNDETKTIDVSYGITRESFWLLRTPGAEQNMVSRIYNTTFSKMYSGIGVFIDDMGVKVNNDAMGLRPALWYRP